MSLTYKPSAAALSKLNWEIPGAIRATVSVLFLVTMDHYVSHCFTGRNRTLMFYTEQFASRFALFFEL